MTFLPTGVLMFFFPWMSYKLSTYTEADKPSSTTQPSPARMQINDCLDCLLYPNFQGGLAYHRREDRFASLLIHWSSCAFGGMIKEI